MSKSNPAARDDALDEAASENATTTAEEVAVDSETATEAEAEAETQDEDAAADAQADDEVARLTDSLLRAKAEVENIRRRSQKEIGDARKFAIEGFAQELLLVKDSLDQAAAVEIADAAAADAVARMKEGIGLTLRQLDLALAKFKVIEIEAAPGAAFDPARHQAISTAPSAEIAPGCIVAVVQKGFMLQERLLRAAMVVVAAERDE